MLKQKASRAIKWSAIDQLIRQGLFFITSVTMARLVAPEAYGTVVLLNLFTGIAGIFVDVGLCSALIQRKETTLVDESTVFWFNFAAGTVMGAGLFLAAPSISSFYGIEILAPIARLYALLFLMGAGNAVHSALFTKRLDFKTPLKVSSISLVTSSLTGIVLAWTGFGVWALVAQSMVSGLLTSVLLWTFSAWRPAFTFSLNSLRSLLRYSGFLFLAALLDSAYQHFYTFLIGKWYGVHDLGIYNRANATKQLPTEVVSGILSRVSFPIFSQVADEPARLARGLRQAVRGIMFLNIPLMLGIAVVAEPLILTLFGELWAPAIPLLQVLALGAVLFPLHVLNLNILTAMGHSARFFKIEIIKKAVGITLIILGAFYGVQGMAWAVVASSFFSFVINAYYNGILLGYGAFKQTRDCLPALLCGIGMAAWVIACDSYISAPQPLRLGALTLTGVLAYCGLAKIFRLAEYASAVGLIEAHLRRR
jgi:teichuronic acid exporter